MYYNLENYVIVDLYYKEENLDDPLVWKRSLLNRLYHIMPVSLTIRKSEINFSAFCGIIIRFI